MFQKIIDYFAKILGLRKKENPDKNEKDNKKNPDDIYPLW